MMKQEIKIFLTALMFYTRIPCPSFIDHSEENLNKSSRYFPLVGLLVGAVAWLVFWIVHCFFSIEISLLLSMTASILTTGAFHEDGFADVCDGFGGGYTREKILVIMKDSRVGTYGVAGLCLLLLLKFFCLKDLLLMKDMMEGQRESIIHSLAIFLGAHSFSRLAAISVIYFYDYVREENESKSKPVAKGHSFKNFWIAAVWTIIPVLLYPPLFFLCFPVIAMRLYLGAYFQKWIGGYTGDCLGATQQMTEVIFYLSAFLLFKFI